MHPFLDNLAVKSAELRVKQALNMPSLVKLLGMLGGGALGAHYGRQYLPGALGGLLNRVGVGGSDAVQSPLGVNALTAAGALGGAGLGGVAGGALESLLPEKKKREKESACAGPMKKKKQPNLTAGMGRR